MFEEIDQKNIPKHLAIIMDGNGRWAKSKGMIRSFGHENGIKSVRQTVETCAKIGVEYLTLYAFSTENWHRPKLEVDTLMRLLIASLRRELATLEKNNIRLSVIGDFSSLPSNVQKYLKDVIDKTSANTRMTLTLALSYGAREEITQAFRVIAEKVKKNIISLDNLGQSTIIEHLYTRNLPDVDLLIRTSGEQRISNFLLWQLAYAELYFTDVLWPDFREKDLYEAIVCYQNRERRFGKTSEQIV